MTQPSGFVGEGFDQVAQVFARVLERQPGTGAALAIRRRGEPVVSLWGGDANAFAQRAWLEDTPSVIWSCTKGLMAILAAQQVELGVLDYEKPVAEYWPEFAQNGKAGILVRELLSHRAGLPAFEFDVTPAHLADWDYMASNLALQAPVWTPGAAHAYHPLTFGWLVGELLNRVSGMQPGELLRTQLSGPLGVDAWIGIPAEVNDRVAELQDAPELLPPPENPPAWVGRTALGNASSAQLGNDPGIRRAQIPAAGGIATASALATIWSSTVAASNGLRSLGADVVREATRVQSAGQQISGALPPYARWGMGFQLDSDARRYLSADSFGHDGFGGQCTFADPRDEIGFAFITNGMREVDDDRAPSLIDALRNSLSSMPS